MRAVLQRVLHARVTVEDETVGEIGKGILLLLGVRIDDTESDATYLAEKTAWLRIFDDAEGKMNLSLQEIGGELLVVSQFTLYGDSKKGRRPSYIQAAPPERATELYEFFVSEARRHVRKVETGRFGAMMNVELVNDGPVTLIVESRRS